jgi:PilZ domain
MIMIEHRESVRGSTFKTGMISFDRAVGVPCAIRNVSNTGACVEVEKPIPIPNSFMLVIKPDNLFRSCDVVWRDGRLLGVRFGARVFGDWTSDPGTADENGFYKVERWGADGRVEQLLYAGSSLARAREIFEALTRRRPSVRLTVRYRAQVLNRWPTTPSGGTSPA